ncbi:MAG: phosphoglycerate kinase [Pacificimonas sp.]
MRLCRAAVHRPRAVQVLLLENVRFYAGEEANDDAFAQQLAALCGGWYVNDAFGVCHRKQASVNAITRHVEHAHPGLLMCRELHFLWSALQEPQRYAMAARPPGLV